MDEKQTTLDGFAEAATPAKRVRKLKTKSAPNDTSADAAQIISYRHTDRRKNNPEVGVVTQATDPAQPQTAWSYDSHLDPALHFDSCRSSFETLIDEAIASGDQEAMRLALGELKCLQSSYLKWTGNVERTSFEVDTVSLHVHERIDPMSILSAVRENLNSLSSGGRGAGRGMQKLKKDIRAELNEDLLAQFHGTVSLPFEAGDNRKVAVKIVDDRGIESLKIISLED
jgi:adenine-specific DNA-methyltransferase